MRLFVFASPATGGAKQSLCRASCDNEVASSPRTGLGSPRKDPGPTWLLVLTGIVLALVLVPRPALADPHAVFYTDRGQAQIFYNVLAALNQADYVEPPYEKDLVPQGHPLVETEPPTITADERLGDFLATGRYQAGPAVERTVTRENDGSVVVTPPILDEFIGENERSNLPRLRVRQVTSDDGDVFFRERLQRRALAEQMRVELAQFNCRILHLLRGPKDVGGCDPNTGEISPVAEILGGQI